MTEGRAKQTLNAPLPFYGGGIKIDNDSPIRQGTGDAVVQWLSSWLEEQEHRGSIPGLATWIFRDWLSTASKSRYDWKIAKSTLILKTTNQPTNLACGARVQGFESRSRNFDWVSCFQVAMWLKEQPTQPNLTEKKWQCLHAIGVTLLLCTCIFCVHRLYLYMTEIPPTLT